MTQLNIELCPSPVLPFDATVDAGKLSGLQGILARLITGILGANALEHFFGNPLDSQISFSQAEGGSLVVAMLITLERAYTEIPLFEAINELSNELFDQIKNRGVGNVTTYHQFLVEREWRYVHKFNGVTEPSTGKKYQVINSIAEYPALPDSNTVYVILAVEGGHNFYTISSQADQELSENMPTVLAAFQNWKTDPAKPRLLYTTITHHAQNALCNHAWAIPANFTKAFEDSTQKGSFTPTGNGLTDWGRQFIDIALTESPTQKRTLIDIKHLSTVARSQVYEHLRTHFPNTPIIASHMGVTGTSWHAARIDHFLPDDVHFPNTKFAVFDELTIRGFMRNDAHGNSIPITFNGWSINLFDEDIIEIVASRGLIGLQLDPRILGAHGTTIERFSKIEFDSEWHNLPNIKQFAGGREEMYSFDTLRDDIFGGNRQDRTEHRWHFCQTIIHIVLVVTLEQQQGNAALAGLNPWNHVCIGSDYDGLISALKTAPTAADIDDLLNQKTVEMLQAMASFLNNLHGNFGGNPIITPFDVLQKLKMANGLAFLNAHFR